MHFFKTHWLAKFFILDLILAATIAGLYYNDSLGETGRQSLIRSVTAFFSSAESDAKEVIRSTTNQKTARASVLIQAPQIQQNPGLPRGCEVTSLAMLLQQAGVKINKMELATEIKKVPYEQNGRYGDPGEGFVGNMYRISSPGYGVYHQPLVDLAGKYLPFRIADLTGKSFSSIIDSLNDGRPVIVITNVTFRPLPSSAFETWHTASGTVRITRQEHAVLITGYDRNHIYFNNPLGSKNESADKQSFIKAWEQMGSQAITYTKFPSF
ncbi:hypothetical protein E4665_17335 [Sporolactobacillus shoreae]|uniref:Peptidase C39-like domain-containing protein n=1 Tax=Sporolactobacillus shoreae TaxID=1465501 RepID=A0A4Z0GIX6_9BACL|nr:C39 family peptidase [Sporolactobacillus shoreae]TGA95875.1 hypothetical protein E4665_17335 [Sporolactobacillus shoreae]